MANCYVQPVLINLKNRNGRAGVERISLCAKHKAAYSTAHRDASQTGDTVRSPTVCLWGKLQKAMGMRCRIQAFHLFNSCNCCIAVEEFWWKLNVGSLQSRDTFTEHFWITVSVFAPKRQKRRYNSLYWLCIYWQRQTVFFC